LLKTALKLEENNELPKEVVELYWDTTRTARRIGQAVSGDLLVTICLLANRATPADPKSFLDRDATTGERVLAKHRDEWTWGTFKSTRSGKVIVQLDDDTAEDREFGPTLVRRPSRAERKLIGE
jgi:hypothetical protein